MREVLEELSGNGSILLGNRQIATAAYAIVVVQDYIETNSFEGKSRVPGLKSARGQLQVLNGPKDLELSLEWTLVMCDGRSCRCIALSSRGIVSGAHSFVVSGEIN